MKLSFPKPRLLIGPVLAGLTFLMIALPAKADMLPSIGLSGATGLIDMPTGEQQRDGFVSISHSQFGPISRNALTFQILPRLSGTFRYIGIRKWNDAFCPPNCSGPNAFNKYYDRQFDLRYQLLDESQYLPAVTVGLQDFIGTGLSMAEYFAATKSFGPRLKVTAGLGFGRLASHGSLGELLGHRKKVDFGEGGNVNFGQWFRGDVAPFAGVEYQISDRLTFKGEYSSDGYTKEAGERHTFDYRSPINLGLEYQYSPALRLGAYSMYGSEVGFNVTITFNPAQRPAGGIGGPGPEPVKPRPSYAANPLAYGTGWLAQSDAKDLLLGNMNRNLKGTGVTVESISVTGDTAQIRYRNTVYDASAEAAGRVARAMTQTMPNSIDTFELVPLANGMPASKIVVKRSDMEQLEFVPDSGVAMRRRIVIAEAGEPLPNQAENSELYPKFSWSLGPYAQTMLFDPDAPFQVNLGARLSADYEFAPGVILSGSVSREIYGGIKKTRHPSISPLPPVRSKADIYNSRSDMALDTLTLGKYARLAPDVYGRVTVGYLEQMFGGISTEVLWRPVNKRWALGAELNYVAQRDPDGGFGFDRFDYTVMTGHVSGYYDLGKGFEAELDVGRYLAGDVGATITLMRTFSNGWQIGAFATKTNVSAKDFGEGSFDKGIKMEIPLSWFSGNSTRTSRSVVLRPLGRDGGARLQVNDRLYETLRGYDAAGIDSQWGRFWR
ncbi:MAG: YjbH domain-containing protein [bacterium]